jgi:hypothetical protein
MRPYGFSYLELTRIFCLQLLCQIPKIVQDAAICLEFRLHCVAHGRFHRTSPLSESRTQPWAPKCPASSGVSGHDLRVTTRSAHSHDHRPHLLLHHTGSRQPSQTPCLIEIHGLIAKALANPTTSNNGKRSEETLCQPRGQCYTDEGKAGRQSPRGLPLLPPPNPTADMITCPMRLLP